MTSLAVAVTLGLGLQAALAAQAMTAHHRSTDDDATKREARILADAIEASLKNAFHPFFIESNFEPDEDYIAGLDDLELDGLALGARVRRAAEPEGAVEGAVEGSPDDDAEEVTGEAAAGEPPATGLRRWVIRIRNVMYGRRDLEGTEDGEAEGEPEPGRTWIESLANWFSHGIKSLLLRFGGGGGGCPDEAAGEVPAGEAPAMEGSGDEAATWRTAPSSSPTPAPPPSPSRRRSRPSSSARSAPEPEPTTPRPWTALPPLSTASDAAAPAPGITPAPAPGEGEARAAPAAASAAPTGTVYDDEAFGGSRNAPPVETNELN